jgi:hypothetical protein
MDLFNSVNINNIKGKIFEGYILDKKDPLNLNRYAVYIPELMAPASYGSKWVWCRNAIGSFTRHRDPMTKIYYSYGSYQPLTPGTRVLVTFIKNNMEDGGYIIAVTSTIKNEIIDRDNYTLVYKTKSGSKFYIDENKDILHISHSHGNTNVYLSKDDIILQINEKNGDTYELNTALKIHRNEIRFIFGDTVYKFDKNGFGMSIGEENNLSFINITKEGIQISGQKYINIVTDGKLSLNGGKSFLTGYDECHVFSNDLRLTGSQKAQLSGTTVNVQGWFDAHVKAMHVGIDAYISIDTQSLFTNNFQLVANNTFAPLYNLTSMIYTNATQIHARASTIEAQDGFILSGMGIGASTSSTVGTSLSTSLLGLKVSLMTMNTGLLLNEPSGAMAALNYILTGTIAGSASPASDLTPVTLPSPNSDIRDPIAGLVSKIENEENQSKYNTTPDEVFVINI